VVDLAQRETVRNDWLASRMGVGHDVRGATVIAPSRERR
jgi:hypothetical protein